MRILIYIVLFLALPGQLSGQSIDEYLAARSKMKLNSFEQAIELFNSYISKKPNDINALYYRGICNFKLHKYNEAIDDFLAVNKRRRGMSTLMLAKAETRLGHSAIAIKYLKEHLGSSFKIPEEEILLDPDFASLERTQEWKSIWNEKEWYSGYDRQLQEANYLKNSGEIPESLNLLNDLDKKGFQKSNVNYLIAEIFYESGNTKDALAALNEAIQSNPKNLNALKTRIEILNKQENYEAALKDCQQLLRYYPDEFDFYLKKARLESKTDDYEQGVYECKNYLIYFPDSAIAYNTMGEIYYENGKFLNALVEFNKSLELDSGSYIYFYNRGKTYYATKTYNSARKDLSMALDLNPEVAEIWLLKGKIEEQTGITKDACYCFKQAWKHGSFEAGEKYRQLCR